MWWRRKPPSLQWKGKRAVEDVAVAVVAGEDVEDVEKVLEVEDADVGADVDMSQHPKSPDGAPSTLCLLPNTGIRLPRDDSFHQRRGQKRKKQNKKSGKNLNTRKKHGKMRQIP